MVHVINNNKSIYYHNELMSADQKETFRVINSLMCYSAGIPLPPATSDQALAEDFVKFFHDKVQGIRQGLDNEELSGIPSHPAPDILVPSLSEFLSQTPSDICNIINKCANKSCSLDVMPTSLIRNNSVLQAVVPIATALVNTSLSSGVFPDGLKRARVTPRLRKTGLAVGILSNYRPVSNIPFLSKVIEKVIAHQLNDHLSGDGLHDVKQSAYKKGPITETALIRIKSDVEKVLNDCDGTCWCFSTLSWNSTGKIGRIGRHLAGKPDVKVTMCFGPMRPISPVEFQL